MINKEYRKGETMIGRRKKKVEKKEEREMEG